MVSIDGTPLAPGNETPTNASQRLPDEKGLPKYLDVNNQNTHAEPAEYDVAGIVPHESSRDKLRYQVGWYWYLLEHNILEPTENVPQHFIHCYRKRMPHSIEQRKK